MEDARMLQLSVIITILSLFLNIATAVDTISLSQPLTRNKTIVSSGQVFELGFFSPGNSKKWFIGIWYKKFPTKPKTVVWVANRDNPLSSSSGTLKIDNDMKLILTDESGKTIWQSNQATSSSNTVAQILDTGNFVVRRENDTDRKDYLWQSFDYPTDTLLPGMKLGLDKKTGLNRFLTSWKNEDDPSSGNFFYKLKFNGFPEFILWKDQNKVYRSRPWYGLGTNEIMNFTFVMDKNESTYSFQMIDSSKYSRLSLNPFGVVQRFIWLQTRETWNVLWYAPWDRCDTYRTCGAFAFCNTNYDRLCQCMDGFEPKNKQEWNLGEWSEGCVRTNKLNCPKDEFRKKRGMNLPESSNTVFNETKSFMDCRMNCLRNCSCTAFASINLGSGYRCVTWVGDLEDLRFYNGMGSDMLYLRVSNNGVIDRLLEAWELRSVIMVSQFLQVILIFLSPFRKRVSSGLLFLLLWLAYLLAPATATYALGMIAESSVNMVYALWAPFLLVHLGGPDTITALSLEDNELWLRHSLSLLFQGWAVFTTFINLAAIELGLPYLLINLAAFIKCGERARSLFLASTKRFGSSFLHDPHPGPNYAKLMDGFSSKKLAKLPTKIVMVPEPKRVKTTALPPEVKELTDFEIVRAAYQFFNTFKGLIADLVFSFRERTESRAFFLQRTPRDAFKVVEVELNFIYDIFYTKVVVVQSTAGYILRFVSIGLTCSSLVLFFCSDRDEIERFDVTLTYSLYIGVIALDVAALIMALMSDWTAVMLTKEDNSLFKCLGAILRVDRDRWPDKNHPDKKQGYMEIFLSVVMEFVAKVVGYNKFRGIICRRWSGSISQYNLLHYCLNPRPKFLDKVMSWFGLTDMADSARYVNTKKFDDDIRDFIFYELKMKAEVADDLETSKEMNSARGDWTLRVNGHYELLPWINDVDYDESLLLWHIATDLCYISSEKENKIEPTNGPNYQRFAKRLSDHMLYLLMMESSMMSTLVGIGETRFSDTCAEAQRFIEERRPLTKEKGTKPDEKHARVCKSLLGVETAVKPVAIKGDRSKSVLFDACMLAKELNKLEEEEKWKIMSKVWVELLCYAAGRCRPITYVDQLSKGGQLITLVWLLMTHFGFGNQFQINEGHARAKLIVGK